MFILATPLDSFIPPNILELILGVVGILFGIYLIYQWITTGGISIPKMPFK